MRNLKKSIILLYILCCIFFVPSTLKAQLDTAILKEFIFIPANYLGVSTCPKGSSNPGNTFSVYGNGPGPFLEMIIDYDKNKADTIVTLGGPSQNIITKKWNKPGTYKMTVTVNSYSAQPFSPSTFVSSAKDSMIITFTTGPTAYFSLTDTIVCTSGDTIFFTDLSIDGGNPSLTWNWNFNDNAKSTLQNPSHTYTIPGTYQVSLVVKDGNGCKGSLSKKVIVTSDSNLVNTSYVAGCPCNEISFMAGGTAVKWDWSFGDDNNSNVQNPNKTYSEPGLFNVSLIGYDANGCSYEEFLNVDVCNSSQVIKTDSKSDYNWYFNGDGTDQIGLSFDDDSLYPAVLNDGKISSIYGSSATVSDSKTGALLFYTDGNNIYDKNHNIMPGGNNLADIEGFHGVLVVPMPCNINQYYVFSFDGTLNKLFYSIVDLSVGVAGQVISSNNYLTNALAGAVGTENIYSPRESYWIVVPVTNTNWNSYRLDENGISLVQTYVATNKFYGGTNPLVEFSNSGRTIAYFASSGFSLIDFELLTGNFVNERYIPTTAITPSGGQNDRVFTIRSALCFSPNNTKLYLTAAYQSVIGGFTKNYGSILLQYDLSSLNVKESEIVIFDNNYGSYDHSDMHLGPDNRIYLSRSNGAGATLTNTVSRINEPNKLGLACNFELSAISLGTKHMNTIATGFQNMVKLIPRVYNTSAFTLDSTLKCPTVNNQTFINLSSLNFPVRDSIMCAFPFIPDSITYSWDFGDGNTAEYYAISSQVNNLVNPTNTYADSGNYVVRLIVSSNFTCYRDTAYMNLFIDPIRQVSFSSDTVCEGNTTNFTIKLQNVDSVQNYSWTGSFTDNTVNPTVIMPTGLYTEILTITDTAGCTASDTNNFMVRSLPQAIDTNYTICRGITLNLHAGIGDSFLWTPNTYIADSALTNPTVNADSNITYQVIVSSQYCGSDTGMQTIMVNQLPQIKTIEDTSITLGESIRLNTSGGLTYVWSPSTYLDNSNIANPTSFSLTSIVYEVTGTDANGCSAKDTVFVTVEVKEDFYLPNAFSPNGENTNDEFKVQGLVGEKTFLLKIYDRWGNKVFESKDKNIAWDGTHFTSGEKAGGGVYVYMLNGEFLNGIPFERKGNVSLIR